MTFRLLLVALLVASCSSEIPFRGTHQAGIATKPQQTIIVAAFDLTTTSKEEVRDLWKDWTKASEALTRGLPLAVTGPQSLPPEDTGETLSEKPNTKANLTLTFGVGPSLFDGRFGLEALRPAALAPLPAFAGDQLRPEWSDGDLVIQVGAEDYQSAYHAVHNLTRMAKGKAVVRWVQDGFAGNRNLQGFIDGTVNVDPQKPEAFDPVVWAQAPQWMQGGSYLVVRRIRMLVEVWDRSSLGDQERTIGRERTLGKELPALAPESHVLQARGGGAEKLFRRPYHYANGLDVRTGQWDSGLLFLAWMKDPRLQFVPIQTRLSSFDLLNEYIQPVGSAVFAVFPGVAPGDYLGSSLFPEPPLPQRIEGLQAAIGAVYPALAQGQWAQVRSGAAAWDHLWKKDREEAGGRATAIDALATSWALALAPDAPDATAVRRVQADLVRALSEWQAQVQPKPVASITDLASLKEPLIRLGKNLEGSNFEAASRDFTDFQKQWVAKEALVRSLDSGAYGAMELLIGETRRALQAGDKPASTQAVTALSSRLESVRGPTAFGPWDAGFLLFREGLEALLVLAALLAFLAKTDQKQRRKWVWSGAGLGLVASVGVALGISVLMSGGAGAEAPVLVEGLTGLAAVVLMLTIGAWFHGKSQVKNWNLWMKDKLGKAGNSPWALASLAFLAVIREGAETVVFFWGLAGSLSTTDLLVGVGGALVVLAILGTLMIGFSKRLPLQWFFPLATALIYYLAVKILGQSLSSLQSAGWLSSTPLGWGLTWESALPQAVLFVVLSTLVVWPLVARVKPAVK